MELVACDIRFQDAGTCFEFVKKLETKKINIQRNSDELCQGLCSERALDVQLNLMSWIFALKF